MKKLILCGSALLLSLGSYAQGWTLTGAHDDFANTTPYKNGSNLEGIIWWGESVFAISRPGTGPMVVTATAAGGSTDGTVGGTGRYPLLGVNFNDSNDDGSGTPFTVDLSGGSNIVIDIENTHLSKLLYMGITLEDINGIQAKIEPHVSDVLTDWSGGQRKALIGFSVAANTRKTVTIDLSYEVGVVGGLTALSYANCGVGAASCPTTSYDIDITKIKGILFTVNFGKDNIDLSEGGADYSVETFLTAAQCAASEFNGDIKIYDFKLGSATTGTQEATISNSLKVYPNPAKEVLNVSFEATSGADVVLSDIVGNAVYTTSSTAGTNNISVNTSGLTTGMYILNISTDNGKVARKVNIK